jgi:hypothetical protein
MATIALSTMRTRLRILLSDSNSKTWQNDTDLDLFLNLALIQFTTDVPIASSVTYTIATDQQADSRTYLLPANFVDDRFVRGYFESTSKIETIRQRSVEAGAWEEYSEPRCYILDYPSRGDFYLPREPQETDFTLYYRGYHNSWLTDDTDTYNMSRDRWGEQAIYAYAAYLAFNPSSARRAQLEQWARRGDQNVGNPLEEEAARWLALYEELLDRHGHHPVAWRFEQEMD